MSVQEDGGALYHNIHAAYQHALRWKITGNTAHADTAFMPIRTDGSRRQFAF